MLSNSRTFFDQLASEIADIYDPGEARSIAFMILEEKAGISKTEVLAGKEIRLSADIDQKISEVLNRVKANEPIQYVLGKAHFYGLEFLVDKHVLIPRQETEELVDWIVREQHDVNDILDIGTGSGCIAVSIAKGYPGKNVMAWDNSEGALGIAKQNALKYDLDIDFRQVDVLAEAPAGSYDLMVSNPPYITVKEKETMAPNVLNHEPGQALFVGDRDPLIFYKAINHLAKTLLRTGGWLYYEINESFGEAVVDSMKESRLSDVELRKDLNGKDRMIRGRKL